MQDEGQPTESFDSGTVIDPEDGLHRAMEELQKKLGFDKFLDLLDQLGK